MKYKLGSYEFYTEEEYLATCRDARKIKQLKIDGKNSEEIAWNYMRQMDELKIHFESIYGATFYMKVFELHQKYESKHPEVKLASRRIEIEKRYPKALEKSKEKNRKDKSSEFNEDIIIKCFEQIIFLVLIIFCLGTLFLQEKDKVENYRKIWQLQNIQNINDTYKMEEISNEDNMQSNLMPEKSTERYQEDLLSERIIQNQKLKEINHDFVGWLSIPNTSIDYPVMFKKEDNDYYLSHDFEQNESKIGLLVLDKRCSTNGDELNILIHGHHMKSGAMFGSLKHYKNETYCIEHPIIQYSTIEEEIEYEIFAVFISSVSATDVELFDYYNYININNESEFNDYIKGIKVSSLYELNINPEYGDRLITLSTCDYSVDGGRLVVVGREIRK